MASQTLGAVVPSQGWGRMDSKQVAEMQHNLLCIASGHLGDGYLKSIFLCKSPGLHGELPQEALR